MRAAVIIPALNAAETIGRCLNSIQLGNYRPHRLIVVDNGSTDRTVEIAASQGAEVFYTPEGPFVPASSRNHGINLAVDSELLVFFDADTVVHEDTLQKIVAYFVEHKHVDALFGSYDDTPDAPNLVSRYKNLLNHHVHHSGRREASTFWTGCGAIRREVIESLGGFDPRYPTLEDVDLGMRMRRNGYTIHLCPEIQVKHLKRYSLSSLWKSDIFGRAVPWTNLMLRESRLTDDLNMSKRNRMSALVCLILVFSPLLAFWSPAWSLVLAGLAMLLFIALNWSLLRLFTRKGGALLAAAGLLLHIAYNLYSTAVFAILLVTHTLRKLYHSLDPSKKTLQQSETSASRME